MLIVLQLVKPRASLRGYCRRFLLEPSANLFVGRANKDLLEDLSKKVDESGICAVLVIQDKKMDMGVRLKVFGKPNRSVIDFDGFQAISRKTKS